MNKELLSKIKHGKVYKRQKQGKPGEIQRCCLSMRDGLRKAKAHMELNQTRDMKANKKGIHGYISSKRKIRENRPTAE